MTKNNPIGWIILCVLAAAFLLAAVISPGPVWVAPLCLVTGLAFAVAAGASLVNWLANLWIGRLYDYRRATSVTEAVALLTQIARMTPEQIQMTKDYVPRIEMATGNAGPLYMLRVEPNEFIPLDFIKGFIDEGNNEWLCPIRRYSEGSVERHYAEKFTSWCIWMGYAAPANGNHPARWQYRETALRAVGITDKTIGVKPNAYNIDG